MSQIETDTQCPPSLNAKRYSKPKKRSLQIQNQVGAGVRITATATGERGQQPAPARGETGEAGGGRRAGGTLSTALLRP